MIDPKNEILFCEYCKTCKHKLCDCEDEPCCDCLATPVNYYSHKPVLWEGVDTLFNKPVERRNHEVERAVREAVYLNAKDTAESIDKQGTIAGKVHMRDLISCAANCISKGCSPSPTYTYGEMENLLTMILTGVFKSDAKVITNDMCKGYTGYTSIDIPNAEEIGERAFFRNGRLDFRYLTSVKKIGQYAFASCTSLRNSPTAFSKVEYIGYGAFAESSVNSQVISRDDYNYLLLNELTYLGDYAFESCNGLYMVHANKLDRIGANAFYNCVNLQSARFDSATTIADGAFRGCISLSEILINSVETIGGYAFQNCGRLKCIRLDKVTEIPNMAFDRCRSLTEVYIPNVQTIKSGAFTECNSLHHIALDNVRSVTRLEADALPQPNDIPRDFEVSVPGELYYAFKNAPDWEPYRQSIVPLADPATIKNVDLSCSRGGLIENAFGTAVEGTSVSTIWYLPLDPFITQYEKIEHTIISDVGYDVQSLYDNGIECTSSLAKVSEEVMMYSVDNVENASYGFVLDSSGWYVSQNKGVHSSAAICRVNLNLPEAASISFSVINYAEQGYDYGVVGELDVPLLPSHSLSDQSNYFWSGKNNNSSTTQSFNIPVPAGAHFIDIKFRKDSGVDKYNDSFKFKINTANKVVGTRCICSYYLENLHENHDIYVLFAKKSSEDANVIVERLYTDNDLLSAGVVSILTDKQYIYYFNDGTSGDASLPASVGSTITITINGTSANWTVVENGGTVTVGDYEIEFLSIDGNVSGVTGIVAFACDKDLSGMNFKISRTPQ